MKWKKKVQMIRNQVQMKKIVMKKTQKVLKSGPKILDQNERRLRSVIGLDLTLGFDIVFQNLQK